jgi:Glycoside Hydrolase Family 113
MNAFHKLRVLLVVGIIVVMGASLLYVILTMGIISTPHSEANQKPTMVLKPTDTPITHPTEVTAPTPKPCSSKQRDFQMGIAFPDWGTTAYGASDTKWLNELPQMQTGTAGCWVEMPVLLHQDSLTSTQVVEGDPTTSPASFSYGIQFAKSLGLHVFVPIQLQSSGDQPWSALVNFSTYTQEQQWFASYWQTVKPYAEAAQKYGVEQFAIGTEYRWLEQNAPASLWNDLISKVSQVFHGTITYDMDWSSLPYSPPSWMRNPILKMIGISSYEPLVNYAVRVDPAQMRSLWAKVAQRDLDNFSISVGKPILLSEIGFPNCQVALYQPWNSACTAPPDQQEQAAATDAALADIIPDEHIQGTFFWGWDNARDFNLINVQAASVILKYYKSLQA